MPKSTSQLGYGYRSANESRVCVSSRIKSELGKVIRTIDFLLQAIVLFLLKAYRYLLRPWVGNRCRFYPSCSQYCEVAVTRFGVVKGIALTLWRLLRCHPFHPGGNDPVPILKKKGSHGH